MLAHKEIKLIDNILGWYGAFAVLLAYILVNFQVLEPTSIIYLLLNLTGALGILVISYVDNAYQPAVLNLIWALIALVNIARVLIK